MAGASSPGRGVGGARAARRRAVRALVRALVGTLVVVTLAGAAAVGVARWLGAQDAEPRVVRCEALSDGTAWYLEPDQADTAVLLGGISLQRGLPARATTIAIATGLQESKLRKITYGDRDSLGIFQQRPSQGWGTEQQVLDPVYATNAFFDGLVQVAGYEDLPVTEAAQAVQRSAYPDAYAQHEGRARAWASALYGYSPAAVSCTLDAPAGVGDAAAVQARVARDLGPLPTSVAADGAVLVDASPLAAGAEDVERLGWAVAHWAVGVAAPMEVVEVSYAGRTWVRTDAAWSTDAAPAGEQAGAQDDISDPGAAAPPGVVRIVLAG